MATSLDTDFSPASSLDHARLAPATCLDVTSVINDSIVATSGMETTEYAEAAGEALPVQYEPSLTSEETETTLRDFVTSIAPGVSFESSPMGNLEFRLHNRTLAQLSCHTLDVALTRALRDEMLEAGIARPHPWLPSTGWVRVSLDSDEGLDAGLDALFLAIRLAKSHQRAVGTAAPLH